jgi:uncharacterized protein (TIGR00369 family)
MRFTSVDAETGVIEAEFDAGEHLTNPVGNVQGGLLAAMLDDCMGPALVCMLPAGEFAPTVSLNVQFHRPAKPGKLKGVGRVVMRGRAVCHLSGELFQNDKLVASATATATVRKLEGS